MRVLERVHAALKVNGVFLIDLNNPFRTINHVHSIGVTQFKNHCVVTSNVEEPSNGLTISKTYTLNPITMQWGIYRNWTSQGKKHAYEGHIYLYTPEQIGRFLENAGLRPMHFWGDFDGSDFTFESQRLIVAASKTGTVV